MSLQQRCQEIEQELKQVFSVDREVSSFKEILSTYSLIEDYVLTKISYGFSKLFRK